MIILIGFELSPKMIVNFQAKQIRKVASISEAIEIVNSPNFNSLKGIITNLEEDGELIFDLLKATRRNCKELPFYILSNKGTKEQIIEAYDYEITKFVIKSENHQQTEKQLWDIIEEINYQGSMSRTTKLISEEANIAQRYLDVAEIMITILNLEGKVELINRKGCEILEAEEEEIIGFNWFDKWVPETQREQLKEGYERFVKGEVDFLKKNENTVITKNNKEKRILWNNSRINNAEGEIKYVISSGEDLSKYQIISDNLTETYFELEQIFNYSPIFMRVIDLDFNIQKANNMLLNAINKSVYDVLGKKCYDEFPGDKCHTDDCPVFLIREKGVQEVTYDVKKKIAKGQEIDCLLKARPYYSSQGELVGIIEAIQDISERKKIELSLKESEEKLKIIFENVYDGIQIVDSDEVIIYSNPAADRLFGVGTGELIGDKISEFLSKTIKEQVKQETNRRIAGETSIYETEITWKDGQTRKVRVHASPTFNSKGEFEYSVSIIYDITKDVLIKERQEFLNTLLRHDVKNRIGIVSSYLTILELTDMDEKQLSYLNKAMKSLVKTDELFEEIHQLLLVGYEEIVDLKLKDIIYEAILVHEEALSSKEIQLDYSIDDVDIRAGGLLKELFSNIIENSIKHSNCKNIKIDTREEGNQIIVNIADDGAGISKAKKAVLFETNLKKRDLEELGLGTLLLSKICQSYGGNIRIVESNLGGLAYELKFIKSSEKK
ncbi:MAG: PAS domain S-box protein [Candidatus Kariarchaeaceae archaeon]